MGQARILRVDCVEKKIPVIVDVLSIINDYCWIGMKTETGQASIEYGSMV